MAVTPTLGGFVLGAYLLKDIDWGAFMLNL